MTVFARAINEKTKMVTIQRSKGYQPEAYFICEPYRGADPVYKGIKPDIIWVVDNCYGEFVWKQ